MCVVCFGNDKVCCIGVAYVFHDDGIIEYLPRMNRVITVIFSDGENGSGGDSEICIGVACFIIYVITIAIPMKSSSIVYACTIIERM